MRTVDPLVSPLFIALARNLKRGTIVPDKTPFATRLALNPPVLPRALVPFVESLDLALLADALRAQRSLYFHPAVRWQFAYLFRLQWDAHEWERLGWDVPVDDDIGRIATPEEVERVNPELRKLVAAHVHATLPDMELVPRRKPPKRGRPSGFRNPHPTDPDTVQIDATTLYESWAMLQARLEQDAHDILARLPPRPSPSYLERVVTIVRDVANEEPLAVPWSALVEWQYDEPPPSNLTDEEKEYWCYLHAMAPHTTANLTGVVTAVLTDPALRDRMRKEGRAGFLASAVLAAHLDVEPIRVQNAIDNYRRNHSV